MKKNVKKIVYLLIYLLTFTPYFFIWWLGLSTEDEMNHDPKLYCSFVLYGILLTSIISIIFSDGWKRRKSSLIVFATTLISIINFILPSILFFNGIIITLVAIKSSFILVILDCIYYFLARKMIDK